MKKKTLCIVGGKSGGHVLPALTLAQRWKEKNPAGRVIMISCGPENTFNSPSNQRIVNQWFSINSISTQHAGLIGKGLRVFKMLYAFFQSLYVLLRFWPEEIISTGGIVAVPVCLAAKLFRRRFVLYELNAEPGRAALFCARFCDEIHVVFQSVIECFGVYKNNCVLVDYPLRYNDHDRLANKVATLKKINSLLEETMNDPMLFDQQRKTIFILGGSQGSLTLNNSIKDLIQNDRYLARSIQVIHQTGFLDSTDWPAFYDKHKIPAHVFSFHDDLSFLYQAADLVLSRAGAGTLFELLFFQKKSIIIPLVAKTTEHQVVNAKEMLALYPHFFYVLEQARLIDDQASFRSLLYKLLGNASVDYQLNSVS